MNKRNVYVFIGPPGSGKGSLAALCVKQLGWAQLSTGNLCRKVIEQGSEVGKRIDVLIKSGKLVPDGLMAQMVTSALEEQIVSTPALVLDGFPRTVFQARKLDSFKKNAARAPFGLTVVCLRIPDVAVIDRLAARIFCSRTDCQAVYSLKDAGLMPKVPMTCDRCRAQLVRRSDDHFSAIKERLSHYHAHARLVLEYYQKAGQVLIDLDVDRPLEELFHELRCKVGH